ncbi:hypothetical protein BCD_1331 (plasmid) [Borrelia crocidurae DOU]|uniref:Uncharacterized protein n=1 Tax=Borrelia crocidurae DOU TaxID=1293575 RepID=W5SKG8_9SPIR|nr:hypothetical protein BCD_1331 [Borrelia crocidurae DOU]
MNLKIYNFKEGEAYENIRFDILFVVCNEYEFL